MIKVRLLINADILGHKTFQTPLARIGSKMGGTIGNTFPDFTSPWMAFEVFIEIHGDLEMLQRDTLVKSQER